MVIKLHGSLRHLIHFRLQGILLAFVFLHLAPYRILLESLLWRNNLSVLGNFV
jgi:hypothetical protein